MPHSSKFKPLFSSTPSSHKKKYSDDSILGKATQKQKNFTENSNEINGYRVNCKTNHQQTATTTAKVISTPPQHSNMHCSQKCSNVTAPTVVDNLASDPLYQNFMKFCYSHRSINMLLRSALPKLRS